MLENGIIEQSFSPFSSPVTLVTKRDKTKRFCIDYRKVNELISSDVHPLPRIEDILDRLAQAKYFSTADISSAYWQVPIHPDSRPLLAFATFEGLYQPTRLPFGLKTSPQIYERAISQVLQRHGLDCVAHYFDDFIIYSNTLEEHQNHLRQFFAFCEAEKLQLNFAKCEFFKQSINFLGYTITAGTITPLTRNTDIIHAIKQPHNRKTLQSFLGAVNVYNKFIPEYARLRAPLNNLLKKDVVWNWNEACQEAFIDLKGNLTQHPILHLYKEGLPCQVYCDASTLGIAGILKQVHPDGNVYPVQYFSRTLRPHEKNYSISELECLAIVESVEKFRIYLMGRKFTIFSDHHALQWLKTIKNPSGRLFRWSLRLSSYEYEVRYIKGKLQYEADLLSRNPFCGFLDATLIKTHQPPPSKESSLTIDRNGLHTVSRKVGPTYGELSQPPESKEPFDLLSLDTIAGFAKYGNTKVYLHVVVDHFSRYAWAFPSKSTSTTTYQQVSVNEALCKHMPSLLAGRRGGDDMYPLGRPPQVGPPTAPRDPYQYAKGHSRSQTMTPKHFEEQEQACKRPRVEAASPSVDKAALEEERKKRQERLDGVGEQLRLLSGQQEELKARLAQARDLHNFPASGHLQAQLDQLAGQHVQLVNEQSRLAKDLRRLDKYCTTKNRQDSEKNENDDIAGNSDASAPSPPIKSLAESHHDSDKMKKSVQISRQLVQETLMDEGLRVAKELANQMDEESGQVIPPPPPALPPPPPRMDGPRPRGRPPKIERDYTVSTLTAPTLPPPSCMGPPSRPPSEPSHHGDPLLSNGSTNGLNSCDDIKVIQENSLNALLAFSQKGLIKQEPNSPNTFKMD
ncbi:K02A2.6-like [Cordylochernes scorpioides]|uniref:K02A2.6-like n=1 Tax=Cordylochernes scorpioides TaxID=51811 RepID=A0ABY6KC12_9ARAC|nr:K02A2.6-like [Cordylochernes scorpioides]